MGMTIDEAINTLEYIKNNPTNDVDAQLLPEAIELFDTAIATMRKYQKIEDIYYHQSGMALENSLRAVLEDGKID